MTRKPSAAQRAAEWLEQECGKDSYGLRIAGILRREDRERRQMERAIILCWPMIEKYGDNSEYQAMQRIMRRLKPAARQLEKRRG